MGITLTIMFSHTHDLTFVLSLSVLHMLHDADDSWQAGHPAGLVIHQCSQKQTAAPQLCTSGVGAACPPLSGEPKTTPWLFCSNLWAAPALQHLCRRKHNHGTPASNIKHMDLLGLLGSLTSQTLRGLSPWQSPSSATCHSSLRSFLTS